MDVISEEVVIELGDIVKIDDMFYIVAELPSCVNYEIGDVIQHKLRYYLHGLDGKSYYNYPATLKDVSNQIIENKGIVYKSSDYSIKLLHRNST